jgi:molybdate transport system substrate-binding protein
MPRACLLIVVLVVSLAGCEEQARESAEDSGALTASTTLNVAAAANLQFAFDEIEAAFEAAHPDIELEVTYGSSGNFYAQLTQDAPFDIFLSADTMYPQKLIDEGFASREDYFAYAIGQIVLWVPNDSTLDLDALEINAVLDPSVMKITIANPELAPYGAAAVEAMRNLGVYEEVQSKLVLGDNISQTAQFIQSGAADVGFIALSAALAPEMSEQGRHWIVPTDIYEPIVQAGVIPSAADEREAAERLKAFILESEGQGILARFGYTSPEE